MELYHKIPTKKWKKSENKEEAAHRRSVVK